MKRHLSERLYLASPVFVQNLLVRIYGFLEHTRRYQGVYHELSAELVNNEFKSKAEVDEIENSLLQKGIKNALDIVPHYQALNIRHASIESFPVLSRAEIFNEPESFIANQYQNTKLLELYTVSSTGNPFKVFLNRNVRRKSYAYAFWNRLYCVIGVQIDEKRRSLSAGKSRNPTMTNCRFSVTTCSESIKS